MGAWGSGVFENDDASDWVWELEDDTDGAVLIEALSVVVDTPIDEQPEMPIAQEAIAAAEIVASAALAQAPERLPVEARAWLGANRARVDRALIALARAAVERVSIDSELRDAWAGDPAWESAIADLLAQLR